MAVCQSMHPQGIAMNRVGIDRMTDAQSVAAPGDRAVETCALTKSYRNPWTLKVGRGIENLDLTVHRGEVLGYLGPNGAGKTTTLKLLTGLHKPTSGSAWLLGIPVQDPASRRSLGFLPEQPYFYDYLSGREYLELAGGLSGLSGAEASRRALHWLGRVGLGDRPALRLRKYSKGMLQRLGLAAALVHEPDLLILDEPMSGLDPFGRRDVRALIQEQRARGTTVLFSSHIIPDVEALCDRVAIVLHGRLHRVGTLSELARGSVSAVTVCCGGAAIFERPPSWGDRVTRRESGEATEFVVHDPALLDQVLEVLVRHRASVQSVTPERASLESLFLAAAETERAGAIGRTA